MTDLPEQGERQPSDQAVVSLLEPLLRDLGLSLDDLEAVLSRRTGERSAQGKEVTDTREIHQVGEGQRTLSGPDVKGRAKASLRKGRALLICGILYPETEWLEWALSGLEAIWGPPHRLVRDFPFDFTDYYRDIGKNLKRAFVSFRGLKSTDALPRWKHKSCALESLSGISRRVNLDPGYVDGARVVLASTKDHSHRIYMGQGVFAEVTMRYGKGQWIYYPHTFPDFKTGRYNRFFSLVKNDWRQAIREEAKDLDRALSDSRNGEDLV